MPVPRVIDLSHHNTVPKDFEKARKAGIIGIIHKLTEGSSYIDDKVEARYYLAQQSKLAWGLYHFMRPGDMESQAHFFFDTAKKLGVYNANTVLVADHEDQGVSGQELKTFLDTIEHLSERSPVVYSGHVLKEQLEGSGYHVKRRLWLAQYSSTATLPEGVDKYWLWQYTQNGDGEDFGLSGDVDLNDIGDADIIEFLDGWSGSYEKPKPPPSTLPRVTISSNVPIELHIGPNIKVK